MKNKIVTIVGALVLLAVFAFYMCSFQVRFTEVAVLKTFGRFKEGDIKTSAGLYPKWPWPIQSVVVTDNRVRILEDTYEETQTKDSQNIMVTTYTCWRIDEDDPYKFHVANSSERDAEAKLKDQIQTEKKTVFSNYALSDVVNTDRAAFKFEEIEQALFDRTAATARAEYGIEIVAMGIRRLSFPKSVSEQIFESMKKREEQNAARFRTEGQAEAQDIVASASAKRRSIMAVADRLAKQIRAEADEEVGAYYKEFDKHAELRIFLDQLEAATQVLKARTTLILDGVMPPFNFDLFNPKWLADPSKGVSQGDVPGAAEESITATSAP